MDEDPGDEDVNLVLAQESSELFHILSTQSPTIIMKLIQMVPGGEGELEASSCSSAAVIKDMLEYFSTAQAAECRSFLQSMCILCENIPMRLESRLMSAAGYANSVCENSSPGVRNEAEPPSLNSEPQLTKRPRIDYWEQYIASVMDLLVMRWERLSAALVREVQLENVWVSLRMATRGRDRPDQTPGLTDRGSRTPEPDGDFGFSDSRVTLETFLQGCAGKVTVLVGSAGSGKTLLMSCLGHQWARGFGPVPSSYLFVLLEFRLLNLLSSPLSLSELLFRHYLAPNGSDEEKRAVVDYLLSNPGQSCWVLDGYDEFAAKLPRQDVLGDKLDPEKPLPVAKLISALLYRQLLPGCTVLVTCRVRGVMDLEDVSDKVGQLMGWDCHQIKEYVHNFFEVKGDSTGRALGLQAADLLLSSQHLLSLSYLPALCNICCICLKHLLLEDEERGTRTSLCREEEGGNRIRRKVTGSEPRGEGGGREHFPIDGTDDRDQLPQVQIPTTLTQVYLNVLCAFLSLEPDGRRTTVKAKTTKSTKFPQRSELCGFTALSRDASELCELSRLAWRGLEESKILFLKEDVPHSVLDFSIRTRLLSQVELTLENRTPAYAFIHLTIQEFLAALRIMTSEDVTDKQLKTRFSLKTRWTTRTDQRTVFTDSLHLYVCGLASRHCTPALVQLAEASGRTGAQSWVQKRQALVLKLLSNLCHSQNLTGPKILELCHCIQESQEHKLAKEIVGPRSTLELRNIQLLPKDIDALAFVVNSVGDRGIGLDFGACSMEPECLDVLPRCQSIHHLSFRSRKYGDGFAEKLSSILPEFTTLRKLEFCGSSLTETGAASLASALEKCPEITELNLSDNSLKDKGIKHVADIFPKLPNLTSVMLGRNNSSLKSVACLVGQMSLCSNIQEVHADGMKEVTVTFSDRDRHKKSGTTVCLLNQKWNKSEMQNVARSLVCCPPLCVLDLSGGQWDVETLRTLTQFLPVVNVSNKILLSGSCSSVEDVVVLTALLPQHPAVSELRIRLMQSDPDPALVSIVFSGASTKTLCLSCCGLLHSDLTRVWRSLGTPCDLTELDLSCNCLGNQGLRKVLELLPCLSNIQEINASNNSVSMEGVLMLAGALCSRNSLTEIHISDGGREQVILKFSSEQRDERQKLKLFRMRSSSLLPSDVTTLCRELVQCGSSLELDLCSCSLKDEAIENLLKVLPKMTSLQRLNVSGSIASTAGALIMVRCLTHSPHVTSFELRAQGEGLVHFGRVKAEQVSCRLTHFTLSSEDMEQLVDILQQVPQLADLDLSSNRLTDEGVKCFIDSLPKLKINSFVNLSSSSSLTRQGLLLVAGSLCTCDDVTAVEVSLGTDARCLLWFRQHRGCEKTLSVTDAGLEREHLSRLAATVSHCPHLTKLELKNNSLQSEWIEDFVRAVTVGPRGFSVSFDECWIRAEKAVGLVCRCLQLKPNIQTIRVQHTTLQLFLTGSTGPASVSLGISDCEVEGRQLSPLRSIIQRSPLLLQLDLDAEGVKSLCSVLPSLPNLSSLSVVSKEACPTVVEKLCEALLLASTVQRLHLSGHVISNSAAQTMTRIIPRLRSLNLSHCSWSAAAGLQLVRALGQCVALEGLCLDSVHLDESSRMCLTQVLMRIQSVRSLRLNKVAALEPSGQGSVLDILAALGKLTLMEELELDGWRMSDNVQQLIRLLPLWTQLRRLSLSKNLVSDQSGDELLEALGSCRHLEELHLSSNHLGDLTAARMALVLPSLTHIKVLDISENCFGSEGSANLAQAIRSMRNLIKIHLTSVGTSQLCAVAAALAQCPLVQDVSLGWNRCGDDVVLELARSLPSCQRLTRIDLESNSVSVVGVESLVKALQSCPALQLIRLWRNDVSPSEAQRLILKDRRLNFSST